MPYRCQFLQRYKNRLNAYKYFFKTACFSLAEFLITNSFSTICFSKISNETDKETQKVKVNHIYDQIAAEVAELTELTDEYLAQKSLT
jgi:hypothetical protein